MSIAEHDKERTPQHQATDVTGAGPREGDDRQLPGIGYRRDEPTLPPAQELPARESKTPVRGQAKFLLTGLGTLVPIAAFTVPAVRRQLLETIWDNSPDARLNRLARQSSNSADDPTARIPRAAVTPNVRAYGRYRLGLLPSLLLGALLGGGATLLYLSRRNVETQGKPQHPLGPQLPQPERASSLAPAPTGSGAVEGAATKEAAVTMVSQAQETLAGAHGTIDEPTSPSTDDRSDARQTTSPNPANTEGQPLGNPGEIIPNQSPRTTAASSGTAEQVNATPAVQPMIGERQPEAIPTSPPPSSPPPAAKAATSPQQQSASVTSPASPAAKGAGRASAASPQAAAKTTDDTATATAESQARIKEHMSVLDNKGMRVGAVDRVEASGSIKLTKDGQGKHHWLPLRWVTRVDTHVHLGRTAQQVRREWKTSAPRAH